MAHGLSWSPMSLRDVDEIACFIERSSPRYAKVVVQKLFAAASQFAATPLASGIAPETDRADIRQLLVYQYRLIARVSAEKMR